MYRSERRLTRGFGLLEKALFLYLRQCGSIGVLAVPEIQISQNSETCCRLPPLTDPQLFERKKKRNKEKKEERKQRNLLSVLLSLPGQHKAQYQSFSEQMKQS